MIHCDRNSPLTVQDVVNFELLGFIQWKGSE
jgi:hypothetical protein